jgi:L-alanine-DL-glutamate epimerase-like enolase superfamily enzyme
MLSQTQAMSFFWKLFEGLPTASDGRLTIGDAPGLGVRLRSQNIANLQLGEPSVWTSSD